MADTEGIVKDITPATEVLTISDRVKSLPQELQDIISEYTFSIEPDVRDITPATLPPPVLQVNRTFRRLLSPGYYSNSSIFRFNSHLNFDKWLKSLDERAYALLHHIEILSMTPFSPSSWDYDASAMRTFINLSVTGTPYHITARSLREKIRVFKS